MAVVYLGLGSNIDAEKNLRLAVTELRRLFGEVAVSPVSSSLKVRSDVSVMVIVPPSRGPDTS